MKNKTYYSRVTQIILSPKEDSKLYDELVTKISIEDELGGEFIEIIQGDYMFRIDPDEWESLKAAISSMIKECRVEDTGDKKGGFCE